MAPVRSGSPISTPASRAPDPDAGPFMLTLSSLQSAAPIRLPRAPQLERFRFFTTRSRQSDGTERRYLHMGYFPSLAEAQKWAQLMRTTYPNAIATLVPAALLRHPDSGVPTLTAPMAAGSTSEISTHDTAPIPDASLTDTQVLSVLETRRSSPAREPHAEVNGAAIPLLRPEDTDTRRIIKEAVVQGAPVCFAVQLLWSVQPIDLASVPSVSIFRAYTLYVTEGQHEGRGWHCLRLGFFSDAISAKQVAYFVRSSFPSVAVLPVTERERDLAKEAPVAASSLADPFQQSLDQTLAADQRRATSAGNGAAPPTAASAPVASKSAADQRVSAPESSATLAETLEMLASSELWENEDSMTATGVRHLAVQVQKNKARRS